MKSVIVTTLAGNMIKQEEYAVKKPFGLVVCGGRSSRMGVDKSMLIYYEKPQRYHVFEMLESVCQKVFISCNSEQMETIIPDYPGLTDLPEFEKIGPMAAVLTAFSFYPNEDFLIIGCDYPFLNTKELDNFLLCIDEDDIAAAFYNQEKSLYEPLLAWYSRPAGEEIRKMWERQDYALQHFLKDFDAKQYTNFSQETIKSIDTEKNFQLAKKLIDSKRSTN